MLFFFFLWALGVKFAFLKKGNNVYFVHFFVCDYIPYSPSWDAYALNDADANLSHENKKEQHEVEGAVTSVKRRIKKNITALAIILFFIWTSGHPSLWATQSQSYITRRENT